MRIPADNDMWSSVIGSGPVIAVAIHDGHALGKAVGRYMALPDDVRRREEDPHTGRLTDIAPTRFVVHRSRFEMDLNRHRDDCVYLTPSAAWGLAVWRAPLPPSLIARSIAQHDAFYAAFYTALRAIQRAAGRFIVLDLHSYNHRRDGADAPPADPAGNPVINIGAGSMNRSLWAPVIDAFSTRLAASVVGGKPLDVRENVRFKGGYLSRFVHETFPGTGCAIAIEVKKVFMDEWTGVLDEARFAEIKAALRASIAPAVAALRDVDDGNQEAPIDSGPLVAPPNRGPIGSSGWPRP